MQVQPPIRPGGSPPGGCSWEVGGCAAAAAEGTAAAPAGMPAGLPPSRAAAVALPPAPPLLLPLLVLVASAVSGQGQATLQSNQGIHRVSEQNRRSKAEEAQKEQVIWPLGGLLTGRQLPPRLEGWKKGSKP